MTQLDYKNAQMASLANLAVDPMCRQRIQGEAPIGYIPNLFENFVAVYKMIESKDYDIAKAILRNLPQSGLVQILLADVNFLQGNVDQSINSLEELNRVIPNDAFLLSTLSYVKGENGDVAEAIKIGETIIKGTTNDDLCSKEYLFNTYYNMACWKYMQQEEVDEPDFTEVYAHLEKCKVLEGELIQEGSTVLLRDYIKLDMKKGWFRKIENEGRFRQILERAA